MSVQATSSLSPFSKLSLRGGLAILELEERLETVQFSHLGVNASRRCDRSGDCQDDACLRTAR